MKKDVTLLLFSLIFCIALPTLSGAQSYKQIRIPLNNVKGVPFSKDEQGSYYIDGFDIDDKGNFYFLGGEKATLSYFQDQRLIFSRKYSTIASGQIHWFNNGLFVFTNKNNENALFKLNASNGEIEKKYVKITQDNINSFSFQDSTLVLEIFKGLKPEFALFDLKGQFVRRVKNPFNLPDCLTPQSVDIQFIGNWKGYYVFWEFDIDNNTYNFTLRNQKGDAEAAISINSNKVGKTFSENPNEHKKIRNNTIYMLGREGNTAIVTALPLKELFPNK